MDLQLVDRSGAESLGGRDVRGELCGGVRVAVPGGQESARVGAHVGEEAASEGFELQQGVLQCLTGLMRSGVQGAGGCPPCTAAFDEGVGGGQQHDVRVRIPGAV
ncbi:hypothetical protein A8W25_06250 [Streptomyces sp. ERV7]|nr:hypothetical protein A8W25_06250 [Streptomyces sp. ERV7]